MIGADKGAEIPAKLPLASAIDLCHALLADVAAASGIRLLFIKGPTANFHGLRPHRVPSDVDVFVEPDRLDELIAALAQHGWYHRPESDAHRYFVRHSVSLINANWPNDIDLHTDYPGMFAPFPRTFERMWENRIQLPVAARHLPAAGRDHSFILGALHALRSMTDPRSIAELEYLHGWLAQERLTEASLPNSIAQEVAALGAAEVLAPEFRGELEIGAPDAPSAELAQWRIGTSQMNRTASWLQLIVATPGLRDRARLVRQAALPDKAALMIDHPSASMGLRSLVSTYLSRWARAALALPKASITLARTGVSRSSVPVDEPPSIGTSTASTAPDVPLALELTESVMRPGPLIATPSPWVASGDDLYVLDRSGAVLAFHGYGCQLVWKLESEGHPTSALLSRIHEESHMETGECSQFLQELRSTWRLAGVSAHPARGKERA